MKKDLISKVENILIEIPQTRNDDTLLIME